MRATDATKASGFCFLAGSLCFGEEGQPRRVWNRGRREEERKEGMEKERREERGDKEGRGGGGEQRGREERELKGSEEERKRLVRAWCFWGNPLPRRLLTQGVFCGVIHLLRSSFFLDFTCKQQCILIPGETYSALILVVEGDF